MQIRLEKYDEKTEAYHPIGYTDFTDYSEALKMLHYMKQNEIPLEVNDGVVDNPDEEYLIDEVSFVMPKWGEEILPYIAVYLD